MSWRRDAFRDHYRHAIGTAGSSNSYVSYLNRVDELLGGLDEHRSRCGEGASEDTLRREPETSFSRARSRANCISALRAYEAFATNSRTTGPQQTSPPAAEPAGKRHAAGEVYALLRQAKVLASKYYRLTGKPLGVTGEVAELEAAEKVGLTLLEARTPGHDAERPDGWRVQIKGRAVHADDRYRGRCPSIKGVAFDSVILVLLDRRSYDALEIWEAPRDRVVSRIETPGSVARNVRRSLGIAQFKSIARRIWPEAAR